jgi:hypothetical protein
MKLFSTTCTLGALGLVGQAANASPLLYEGAMAILSNAIASPSTTAAPSASVTGIPPNPNAYSNTSATTGNGQGHTVSLHFACQAWPRCL